MANTVRGTEGHGHGAGLPRRREGTVAAVAGEAGIAYPTRILELPGLPRAIVVEMPQAHSAVAQVFVRAGSGYETRANNGISHFLEHVLFAGSESYPTRAELQRAIDATGGFFEAVTHKELTEYSFQVLPGDLSEALRLLGDSIVHPSFSQTAVDSEREIVLEEMLTGDDGDAKDPVTDFLWGPDSLGLPTIGSRQVIERMRPQDLQSYWREAYTLENMLVCVAGRVDPDEVAVALESFRGLPRGSGPLVPRRPRKQTKTEFWIDRERSRLVDLCLMLRCPGWEVADSRLHTMLDLVTQYYHTRVYQELVGPDLPVYDLYAEQETFITEGYIYFYFNVSRGRFFQTLERVLGELDRLRSEGIPEEDLAVTKKRYALNVVAELDDPRDVAYWVGSYGLLYGRDRPVSIEDELSEIDAITAPEVRALIAQVFVGANLFVVARGGLTWLKERKLRKRLESWLP